MMIQLKSSFKGCFKDNPFYYKVKVHTWLRNTYSIAVYGKVFFLLSWTKKESMASFLLVGEVT